MYSLPCARATLIYKECILCRLFLLLLIPSVCSFIHSSTLFRIGECRNGIIILLCVCIRFTLHMQCRREGSALIRLHEVKRTANNRIFSSVLLLILRMLHVSNFVVWCSICSSHLFHSTALCLLKDYRIFPLQSHWCNTIFMYVYIDYTIVNL